MITTNFDALKAELFTETLVDSFNKAALSMMISLGHRTGLFDVMADEFYGNSQELADRAGLSERYVREWLGSMVTGGIVDYHHELNKYKLPVEHAAFLTRAAQADNFAVFAEFIFSLALNSNEIEECFKTGKGISYDKYHRFYHAMDDDQSMIGTLFSRFLPLMPELVAKLESGMEVLDAGCGTGGMLIRLAETYPQSRFTGLDLSEYAIAIAKKKSAELGLKNINFIVQDLTDFDQTADEKMYDLVMTIDSVHDQNQPKNLLKGIHKSLKNDGVYLMVDINGTGCLHKDMQNPLSPMMYAISCMHCVPVSLGQGGEGLGAMWGERKIKEFLTETGFSEVETHTFDSDPLNNWFVIKK